MLLGPLQFVVSQAVTERGFDRDCKGGEVLWLDFEVGLVVFLTV